MSYGASDAFPGFFVPDSGHPAPSHSPDLAQIARTLRAPAALPLPWEPWERGQRGDDLQ